MSDHYGLTHSFYSNVPLIERTLFFLCESIILACVLIIVRSCHQSIQTSEKVAMAVKKTYMGSLIFVRRWLWNWWSEGHFDCGHEVCLSVRTLDFDQDSFILATSWLGPFQRTLWSWPKSTLGQYIGCWAAMGVGHHVVHFDLSQKAGVFLGGRHGILTGAGLWRHFDLSPEAMRWR